MITYNSKDLIQQATMLADLQNSDFISWKENIMFLDNAWTELYQQIINHGDKTFLKEFSFSGSRTFLPDDFYQLYYICYSDGQYERPINRKAKTSTGQGPYYDIVNNELIIYRDSINSLNKIIVRYYPIKFAITYSPNMQDLSVSAPLEIKGTIIDVADKYVLTSTGYIYDVVNRTVYSSNNQNCFMLCMKAGLPLAISNNNINICYKVDNKLYNSTYSNGTLILKRGLKEVARYAVSQNNYLRLAYNKINTISNDVIYFVENSTIYAWNLITDVISVFAEDAISDKVVSFDGHIYYETINGIFRDDDIVVEANDYDDYNGTMKADLQSGYGILTDNKFLFGSFNNTELSFPNNFYYNYLAYKLAIYYKTKQNADPSSLFISLADAEKTLYDTMPRDENNFVRISNSYAY
jgi:hypothetical protein